MQFPLQIRTFYTFVFWICFSGLIALVFDFGFEQSNALQTFLNQYYYFVLGFGVLSTLIRDITRFLWLKWKVIVFDASTVLLSLFLFYGKFIGFEQQEIQLVSQYAVWLKLAVLLSLFREFAELKIDLKRTVFNPAQVFILSFLAIILLGSFLLMLPKATYSGLSFMDALFTSTSAVCVTGLIVVDTATHFTQLGQTIILILIQTGGLGILTFASYFSYFFKGGTSYENQLALGDISSSKKLGEVFSTFKYIILITVGIELFASGLIYVSLDAAHFTSQNERMFFAIFHSVSAFCNAGFSTLSAGIYDNAFRFNYFLQFILILTFVLGGLGFPIVVNLLSYLRYKLSNIFSIHIQKKTFRPWVLNINSRITLITTGAISLIAFVLFYLLEYNNTLAEHSEFGKIITALFGATTPRTAGFNTIDNAAMSLPTILMVLLLMWIGASPQSTGGGIKTSTFAIATLNILSLGKGKSRIEIYRREIADISVRRAFAIISLSLIVIGFAVLLIAAFDPQVRLIDIVFESISAYSTVGLSLGITASLSNASKFVLILVMFVGRVSMLSLVIAVIKKVKHKSYAYPREEINMN
ncbi:MAG: potassium transporter TrkG [Bacteroidota bacterium]|nr:potassium transporter TrkG [Bacteroidota bacterium]